MPEYALDCHHPDAEIEEIIEEEDELGRAGMTTRYYCPDCNRFFSESGHVDQLPDHYRH